MERKEADRIYIAIDLKSFYASVECLERGLDPLTTNLVVADKGRTEKTICLAVSPSLKSYGIPGRPRLFEVVQKVRQANERRRQQLQGQSFKGSSCKADELNSDASLAIDYIVAPPRMAHYVACSSRIFEIYLKHVAPEDIHVYSIDEVFIDATAYLPILHLTAREFARLILRDVLEETGITATAGIGTNLYLAKVAMDIVAKHTEPDENGARMAELDERSYRETLWTHRPLHDFWRVGRAGEKKLEQKGLFTMGDIARCSLDNEKLLYDLLGVNAEFLIDHAWGWEPCTLADIKAYKPVSNSISSGQVLHQPYPYEKAKLIVREMADLMALDLVDKGLVTDQMVLTVGYDIENLKDPVLRKQYTGPITTDTYGRKVPKHAHGTIHLDRKTASSRLITDAVMNLFDRIIQPALLVRRVTLVAADVCPEQGSAEQREFKQLDMFTDYTSEERQEAELEREKRQQEAILSIRKKYGKNAILKGMNLEEGATSMNRNRQIGGHNA